MGPCESVLNSQTIMEATMEPPKLINLQLGDPSIVLLYLARIG